MIYRKIEFIRHGVRIRGKLQFDDNTPWIDMAEFARYACRKTLSTNVRLEQKEGRWSQWLM